MLTSSKLRRALLGFGQRSAWAKRERGRSTQVKDQYDVDVVGQCLGRDGACSGAGPGFFLACRALVLGLAGRAGPGSERAFAYGVSPMGLAVSGAGPSVDAVGRVALAIDACHLGGAKKDEVWTQFYPLLDK